MINTPWKILYDKPLRYYSYVHTCNEFKIVNIHANTTVFSLIASNPNTQVQPSIGVTIIAAFANALT